MLPSKTFHWRHVFPLYAWGVCVEGEWGSGGGGGEEKREEKVCSCSRWRCTPRAFCPTAVLVMWGRGPVCMQLAWYMIYVASPWIKPPPPTNPVSLALLPARLEPEDTGLWVSAEGRPPRSEGLKGGGRCIEDGREDEKGGKGGGPGELQMRVLCL